MATRGMRRVIGVALALALPVVTGCGVVDDARLGVVDEGYLPLTADDFAQVTTEAMVAHPTFHMDMDAGPESMSMDARFDGDENFDMAGTYDDGTSVSDMVVLGDEVYVRDEGKRVYYQFPDYLADQVRAEMRSGNPREMAATLAAGIDSLTYAGAHEVDYGTTYRYDLTVTKAALAEQMDIPESAVPDVTYTIWLDEDYLIRRMLVWVLGTTVDVTIDDWGEPVTIQAPPDDEIEPLPLPTDDT